MRALEFREFGDPSNLQLVNRPDLHATDASAIVRVAAASINPSDVKNVAGRMSQTTLPRIPGRDYSGVVVEGPPEWIGAAVWGTGGDVGFTRDGTHAEYVEVPRDSLVRKPESLAHEQAASMGVTFVTAWLALESARLAAGETLAAIGARGGVGAAAVQMARRLGARVIEITRESPAGDSVRADVVLDTVGGPMFESALKLLAHGGRLVEISAGTERRVSFDLVNFYHNESHVLGVDSLKRNLTAAAEILRKLADGVDAGAYVPPSIGRVYPLTEARQAYQSVADGQAGRAVLTP